MVIASRPTSFSCFNRSLSRSFSLLVPFLSLLSPCGPERARRVKDRRKRGGTVGPRKDRVHHRLNSYYTLDLMVVSYPHHSLTSLGSFVTSLTPPLLRFGSAVGE